jgi:formylglycine-generating enzyme required for sulfatase activity
MENRDERPVIDAFKEEPEDSLLNNLAYSIVQAKYIKKEGIIFFLGAGASKTAGIPLAKEVIQHVLGNKMPDDFKHQTECVKHDIFKENFESNPKIQNLKHSLDKDEKDNYVVDGSLFSEVMGCLDKEERKRLFSHYVECSGIDGNRVEQINGTHIIIAYLMKLGFIDYVLTTNFDDIMVRATALFNNNPPRYDLSLNQWKDSTLPDKGTIIYLHGQHNSLRQINTDEELNHVKDDIKNLFAKLADHLWIVIGYSGTDPVFDRMLEVGCFTKKLYWIGCNQQTKSERIEPLFNDYNQTYFVSWKEYADEFMSTLLDKIVYYKNTLSNTYKENHEKKENKNISDRKEEIRKALEEKIDNTLLNDKDELLKKLQDDLQKSIAPSSFTTDKKEKITPEKEECQKNLSETERGVASNTIINATYPSLEQVAKDWLLYQRYNVKEIDALIWLGQPIDKNGKKETISLPETTKQIICEFTEKAVIYWWNKYDWATGWLVYEKIKNGFNLSKIETIEDYINSAKQKDGFQDQMVKVEGGTFTMGSDDYPNTPIHDVTLSSFQIGKYTVTQEQWQSVMDNNPAYFHGENNLPVENVSWDDVQEFLRKLNEKYNIKEKPFRLPTEAEWEYAARGGKESKNYKYSGGNDLKDVSWCYKNSGARTRTVGEKQPNELGLYDMSGNIWEWCSDWYDEDYYKKSPKENPQGSTKGRSRVVRGGSWRSNAEIYRVSIRNYCEPGDRLNSIGFRLARSL